MKNHWFLLKTGHKGFLLKDKFCIFSKYSFWDSFQHHWKLFNSTQLNDNKMAVLNMKEIILFLKQKEKKMKDKSNFLSL